MLLYGRGNIRDKRENMNSTNWLYTVLIKGITIFAVWLAVCTVSVETVAAKPEEKQNFNVNVECGIDGVAVYGRPVAVKVTIESRQNFNGTLRVVPVSDDMQEAVAYGESVTLAEKETKTFHFVPSSVGGMNKIRVELVDDKDRVVYAKEEAVSMQSADSSLVVGILSDDFSALNYFDGLSFPVSGNEVRSSILELGAEQLWTDGSALAVMDCIMIDNFDTAVLSDGQYEALKQWVENGGVLFIALGSHYQNVLHRFSDDFITGTFGDLEKKDIVGIPDVDCVDFAFDGAEALSPFADDGTVYCKNIGVGNVVLVAYSLGMEPVASHADKTLLAAVLVQSALDQRKSDYLGTVNSGNGMIYTGKQLAQMADSTPKPSTLLYGGILFIYVIIIGPVLYLMLKAVKKREKIWIAVPVIALVFTGIIYVSGFFYRVRKPMVNTFTLVSLNGDTKREQVYTQITCPSARQYTVSIDGRYTGFAFGDDGYSYQMFSSSAADSKSVMLKRTGEGTDVVMDNKETFDSTSFFVQGTDENDIGTLDYDLVCTTTGFTGTITNNTKYDMKGVVVSFENHLYLAGDIAKGETVSVQQDKLMESYGYAFDSMWQNSRNNEREEYIAYSINSAMESSFVGENVANQGCIWGRIGDYQPELTGKSNVKQNGIGIIYDVYTAQYADVTSAYFFNIKQAEKAAFGTYDEGGRLYAGEEVIITYDFSSYPELTTLQLISETGQGNASADLEFRRYALVYAMNTETGVYELLFQNGDTESLAKYMADGELMLKYEQPDPSMDAYSYIPKIAARGDD